MHEIFAWLYENQKDLLITSGINGGSGGAGGEVLQDSGLYAGHEYSLLKLELVRNKSNKVIQMVHLRNPWGQAMVKIRSVGRSSAFKCDIEIDMY